MRRAGRFAAWLAVVLACLVAWSGCSTGAAFRVDGEGISLDSFNKEVQRRLAVSAKKNPAELKGEKGQRLKAETRRQVATEMIRAKLMREQAARLGVTVASTKVAQKLDDERGKRGADRFEKDLEAQGLTADGYRRKLEEQVLVDELGAKLTEEVSVTTDEAESFFLTHQELFAKPAAIHVAHVVLDSEGQAQVVADEVRRGVDFATMAKNLSKDAATRGNGGDMGWIEQGSMEPAFEQVAFALKPGVTSGVVKTSDGYQVIKVLDRREATTPTFNEAKAQAVKLLESRRKEEKFSDWLRTVYANARVEVLVPDVGKWDPRLGMVVER